ncbi:MAG: FAD-binding oxidoreductase [Chloroflexota bacterium]
MTFEQAAGADSGTLAPRGLLSSREFEAEITATEPVMGDSVLLTVAAPVSAARECRPGRFFEIVCRYQDSADPLLRRPYSVYAADRETGALQFLVRPYGRGSTWLSRRQPGERLSLLGPLGNTYAIDPQARNLLLVAGGVGVAPMVMLAHEAVATGRNVTFLLGAATADGLLAASNLPEAVEYIVATDDGSKGHRGFVTSLAGEYVRWADQIFACGPEPMYRALRLAIEPHRINGRPPVLVSM